MKKIVSMIVFICLFSNQKLLFAQRLTAGVECPGKQLQPR